MSFIEQEIVTKPSDLEGVKRLCQTVFGNDEGRRLLALLSRACPPMRPRFNPNNFNDTHGAAFRDGQADVVGFLWRYGSDLRAPIQVEQQPSKTNDE